MFKRTDCETEAWVGREFLGRVVGEAFKYWDSYRFCWSTVLLDEKKRLLLDGLIPSLVSRHIVENDSKSEAVILASTLKVGKDYLYSKYGFGVSVDDFLIVTPGNVVKELKDRRLDSSPDLVVAAEGPHFLVEEIEFAYSQVGKSVRLEKAWLVNPGDVVFGLEVGSLSFKDVGRVDLLDKAGNPIFSGRLGDKVEVHER